jgi:mannose-6-phosphate isomerase-like protein (cupin superfamily)
MKDMRYGRGTVRALVGPDDGARQLDVHINTINPGTEPGPRHYHSANENAYFVLAGEGSITVGGDDYRVEAGDFLFIPPLVPHSVHNTGEGELRLIEIYAPATVDFVEV